MMFRTNRGIIAVVLLFALLLCGCGGPDAPAPSETPEEITAAPAPLETPKETIAAEAISMLDSAVYAMTGPVRADLFYCYERDLQTWDTASRDDEWSAHIMSVYINESVAEYRVTPTTAELEGSNIPGGDYVIPEADLVNAGYALFYDFDGRLTDIFPVKPYDAKAGTYAVGMGNIGSEGFDVVLEEYAPGADGVLEAVYSVNFNFDSYENILPSSLFYKVHLVPNENVREDMPERFRYYYTVKDIERIEYDGKRAAEAPNALAELSFDDICTLLKDAAELNGNIFLWQLTVDRSDSIPSDSDQFPCYYRVTEVDSMDELRALCLKHYNRSTVKGMIYLHEWLEQDGKLYVSQSMGLGGPEVNEVVLSWERESNARYLCHLECYCNSGTELLDMGTRDYRLEYVNGYWVWNGEIYGTDLNIRAQ